MKLKKTLQARFKHAAGSIAIAALMGVSAPAHALYINLTSTGNATADAGFREAADIWQSVFTDNVTVNITAGFAVLDTNILGQAGSNYFDSNFLNMKTALGADATSASDGIMVAGLSAGSTYSKLINGTAENSGAAHLQSGITELEMTTANAKALGLLAANNTDEDAAITFSSLFTFDFDASDGIGAGLIDFVGVAIHEIGHALGFTSGVDVLDFNRTRSANFRDAQFSPFATVLDFTRCSSASQAAGADMDWTIGTAAKDFAIDGNCSGPNLVTNAWSTGQFFGDGRQASHWKDDLGLGILDPTFDYGEFGQISGLDILAFDVIGWDVRVANAVPEPSSALLLVSALFGLGALRQRKNAA